MIAYVSKEVCLEINARSGIKIEAPDITKYTTACLVGDEFNWPLAFYKVIDAKL